MAPQYLNTHRSYRLMATYMSKKIDIKKMVNDRKIRGMSLLEDGIEPHEINKSTWIVPSQSGDEYHIR